jgi:hypothetical protein
MASSHQKELQTNLRFKIYEMVPGLLTWTTFSLALIFSFVEPLWAIYFVIVFDLYWVFRVSYFIFYISLSWRQYKQDSKIDWQKKLETELPDWQKIYQLIFLPTYDESLEVIRETFKSLITTKYPLERIIVALGGEERAGKELFLAKAEAIQKEFGDKFCKLIFTVHPQDLPEEVAGKGANINYMGHQVKEIIDQELKIPYVDIIVSSFDVDTCAHEQYFSCLTYKYLTNPNKLRTSYQPIALYNNNMWQSDSVLRVAAFGTTFWLMTDLMRPERLFTFSSHSMSWQMLVDVDFWEKDIVTEDSRIFLQGFLRYDGDYRVMPIFVPVSMNTVAGGNWWQGLRNLYKQQRRWAWGVEHLPYMMWYFREKRKQKKIPLSKRIHYIWNLGEGMYSWATVPILIFILGRLPLFLARGSAKATVVAQNAPFVLEILMQIAMAGILVSAVLSLALLPPRPNKVYPHKYLIMILQWVLLPVTLILFGSIPATEAQTRLMLGGKFRLGFHVSPKEKGGG